MLQSLKRTYIGFVLIKISQDVEIRCREISEVHKIWWCRIYKAHLYEFRENTKTSLDAEISLGRNLNSTWALIILLPLKCKYMYVLRPCKQQQQKRKISLDVDSFCYLNFKRTCISIMLRSLKRTYILAVWIFRKCMKFGNAKFIKTMASELRAH